MPQHTADPYHAQPDEAFNTTPEPLPADFEIVSTQPPPCPDFKASGARFVKGHDPRRHTFTAEEHCAGFWAGLASYVEQGGEAGEGRVRLHHRARPSPSQATRATPEAGYRVAHTCMKS